MKFDDVVKILQKSDFDADKKYRITMAYTTLDLCTKYATTERMKEDLYDWLKSMDLFLGILDEPTNITATEE